MPSSRYDELEIRCPKLGGEVNFYYCRTSGKPFCSRIIFCWAQRIDIGGYLAENYSPEELKQGLIQSGSSRLETILNSVEKAKKLK